MFLQHSFLRFSISIVGDSNHLFKMTFTNILSAWAYNTHPTPWNTGTANPKPAIGSSTLMGPNHVPNQYRASVHRCYNSVDKKNKKKLCNILLRPFMTSQHFAKPNLTPKKLFCHPSQLNCQFTCPHGTELFGPSVDTCMSMCEVIPINPVRTCECAHPFSREHFLGFAVVPHRFN